MPQSLSSARFIVFALLSVFFALGIYELAPSLTPAAAEAVPDGVEDATIDDVAIGHTGMPASNARVKPILLGHREQLVVVCVAGCKATAEAVQILPNPARKSKSQVALAGVDAATEAAGNAVICLAGCGKRSGEVVQRIQGLRTIR